MSYWAVIDGGNPKGHGIKRSFHTYWFIQQILFEHLYMHIFVLIFGGKIMSKRLSS